MRLSELAADLDLEESGVWVPYKGDVEFKVVAAGSKRAKKAYRRYMRPVERTMARAKDADEDPPAVALAFAQYLVHGLLDGWKGIEDDNGEPVPFSVDVAVSTLALPQMKYVRGFIMSAATDQDTYQPEVVAEDAAALKSVPDGDA